MAALFVAEDYKTYLFTATGLLFYLVLSLPMAALIGTKCAHLSPVFCSIGDAITWAVIVAMFPAIVREWHRIGRWIWGFIIPEWKVRK